ncbi:flagellar biosynthesis protein FlhG [Humidesulfovibrio mexicanus]|uniref:Flagellar biosynthesis protein FlhG n=1 Tax=Humidesulfovibrio mexicanus TaxID=147047 RepID=A0A239CYC6_9BACT|nr:MinD/ParA family protein [Humidesulfovibrio mexicanus]SNS24768.1 flagellar biosynthesis protein FlhG [Humidesulfovibrio mexicanus]
MSDNINPGGTVSLCIMSGKGGVGKTNLSLNLGFSLRDQGHPSLLMDCDLGLANLDVLLGLAPEKNLQDMLAGSAQPHEVVQTIEPGLDILPAASGVPEMVEMDQNQQAALFDKLTTLVSGYEFLILDLGAGISGTVLSLARMAQMRVVLVTPEPTSLTDGYAIIKVLHSRFGVRDFLVVVNQATSQESKETFQRLNTACKTFLGFELVHLGHVRLDRSMTEAVINQKPLARHAPNCSAIKDITELAMRIARYRQENLDALQGRQALKNILLPST